MKSLGVLSDDHFLIDTGRKYTQPNYIILGFKFVYLFVLHTHGFYHLFNSFILVGFVCIERPMRSVGSSPLFKKKKTIETEFN